jgi:hypothetical protein
MPGSLRPEALWQLTEVMARATGLEPAASGVTGRKISRKIHPVAHFSDAMKG